MSDEYTPTTEQVRATYLGGTLIEFREEGFGRFQRWLAEVERAAAVRALEEFAEQWATQDGIEALMFATDDVSAVQITEKALLARAEAYRREGR